MADIDCTEGLHIWDSACWANDESHLVLQQLINHNIQNVLTDGPDTTKTVLNSILYYFNTGLLSGAFFIFAFILIAGVIYTAQDGQFLGRKWGSAWIPLRAVFGTLMLFPVKASGFCFAQYIMLLITYIGIGLANYVWYGVTGDIQDGRTVPVQDITVKMQLVYHLGQLMITDMVDQKIVDLFAEKAAVAENKAVDVEYNVRRQIPIIKDYFQVVPPKPSLWSSWFPTTVTQIKPPMMAQAQNFFPRLIDALHAGLMSGIDVKGSGATEKNYFLNAYVGTLAPYFVKDSVTHESECGVMTRVGNCLSFAKADLTYRYQVRNATTPQSFIERIRAQIKGIPVYGAVRDATCFALAKESDGIYRTDDVGGCISDSLETDYNQPASGADPLKTNSYYGIVDSITQYYATYDGSDKADFITASSAKGTDSRGNPLATSTFGYMCGYSDLVAQGCKGDLPADKQAACQKRAEFAGGWFCAGNRYLQLDNLLGINAQNFRTAIEKFIQLQKGIDYQITVTDNGSSLYYVYAVPQLNSDGNFVLTDGAGADVNTSGPAVARKLIAKDGLRNNAAGTDFFPTLLTWSTLLFPADNKPSSKSLLDQAVSKMCSVDYEPTEDCQAYGQRLTVLLKELYQSMQVNQPVADRILNYLNLRYVMASDGSQWGEDIDPVVILVDDPAQDVGAARLQITKFLYNLVTFGIYNGFIKSENHNSIPANLPAPPINPIAKGNSVLTSIFEGLLGKKNPDTQSQFDAAMAAQTLPSGEIGSVTSSQIGWLSALYGLGSNCRKAQVDKQDLPYCNDSIIQQQHTMIQKAQVVGLGLIGGVIDSMTNAFNSFTEAVTKIADKYNGQAEKAMAQGMFWHGFLGGIGDIAAGAQGAGPIGMAVAQGQMMVSFAHFGLQLMWLPIVLFILGSLFTAGLSFAVIIPLTPFILFWAGKVAWILLFIESLLAAPLMALGIVYPDGHDLFGQSEPGVKLAVGMMLMPVLMVIGLLMGITLTYVVIDFTAIGFKTVMHSILGMTAAVTTGPDTTRGIISCFLILFYSYVLVMAFEKCFSAIHILPEKVLQWIGIQGQKFGEQEGQQMRSQMQQAGKEGSQAGGQSMTQGMQASEQKGKAEGESGFKKAEAWMSSVNRAVDSNRSSMMSGTR